MSEKTTRTSGHLTVYLVWPILAGLGLSAILAVSVGGLMWLIGDRKVAPIAAGVAFFSVMGLATLVIFAYAAMQWAGPGRIEELRQTVVEVEPEPVEVEPRWIVRTPRPVLAESVASEIRPIEPDVDPDIRDLFRFICTMWPTGDISQANCARHGFSRRYWDRYIGGKRYKRGQESGRGLLDRAGAIRKDGQKWVIDAPLNEVLAINAELQRYAEAKAQMVRLVKSDKSSQVRDGGMSGLTDERGIGG